MKKFIKGSLLLVSSTLALATFGETNTNKSHVHPAKRHAKRAKIAKTVAATQAKPAVPLSKLVPKSNALIANKVNSSPDTIRTSSAAATSASASSSSSIAPQTTVANASAAKPGDYSRIMLRTDSLYSGPRLSDGNMNTPNPDGTLSDGLQNMDTAISVGYRTSPTTWIGGAINFNYIPVGNMDMTLEDPALKLVNSKFITAGKFSMYADARAYLPVSQKSQNANELVNFRTTQYSNFELGRLTIGVASWERYYIYGANADMSETTHSLDFRVYAGPNLAYQITPTVQFTLLYEMEADHKYGDAFGNLTNGGTDIEPGINWDITPKISLNPYLNMYTGNKVTMDSTSIGFYLGIGIL